MYEGPIQDLIDELARLPGIGPKSAQRLAFHLVKTAPEEAKRLAEAIVRAKDRVSFCRECGNVAEGELCRVCRDPGRDATVICVVEEPKDAATIEKAGVIKGRYHILGAAIALLGVFALAFTTLIAARSAKPGPSPSASPKALPTASPSSSPSPSCPSKPSPSPSSSPSGLPSSSPSAFPSPSSTFGAHGSN